MRKRPNQPCLVFSRRARRLLDSMAQIASVAIRCPSFWGLGDVQEVMQNLVGIFRTDEDLKKALAELVKLKSRAAKVSVEGSRLFNPGWHLSFDLKAMLT